jgi:hypothetical protein
METAGQIIILIIFLAIVGHMVYEIFFKKKFGLYTIEDFRQARITEGRHEYATDEEIDDADRLLTEVFESWSVVDVDDNGEELRSPLKAKQMKNSTALLNAVIAIAPTDENAINRLNDFGDEINNCNKRKFNGSKTLIITTSVIFILISLISDTWAGAGYFIGSIIFYILASLTPLFVINRKIVNGKGGKRSFMSTLIGGLFGTIATAKTVKYVNRNTGEVVDTDNSETWISTAFTLIVLAILSALIGIIAIINYIRNYWLNM